MGSEQSGSCCPPGSWPALKTDYKPTGQTIHILDTDVYHAGSGDKVLLLISDIFGIHGGRHKAVADTFAALGYNVFLPQVLCKAYDGPMEMGPIMKVIKEQQFSKIEARIQALKVHLDQHGFKKYLCMGFCWGVWAAFKLSLKFPEIVCIVGMHPSLGVEKAFGGDDVKLAETINCPAFFHPAGNDPANVKKGGEIVEVLTKKFGDVKVGSIDYPDMEHGWTVRGDLSQEKVHRDVQGAFEHAHKYFSQFI